MKDMSLFIAHKLILLSAQFVAGTTFRCTFSNSSVRQDNTAAFFNTHLARTPGFAGSPNHTVAGITDFSKNDTHL